MCRYCFHSVDIVFVIARTLLFAFFNLNYCVFELALCVFMRHSDYFIIARTLLFAFFNFNQCVFELALCAFMCHSDYFIIARTLRFVFLNSKYSVFELDLCVVMCRYCFPITWQIYFSENKTQNENHNIQKSRAVFRPDYENNWYNSILFS